MVSPRDVGIPPSSGLWSARRRPCRRCRPPPRGAPHRRRGHLRIENGTKRLSGQLLGLAKAENLRKVEAAETALKAAVARDPDLQSRVGESWDHMAQARGRQKALRSESAHEGIGRVALLSHALTLVRLSAEEGKPSALRLTEFSEGNLKATKGRLLSSDPCRSPWMPLCWPVGLQEAKEVLWRRAFPSCWPCWAVGRRSPWPRRRWKAPSSMIPPSASSWPKAAGAALEASTDP